MSKFFFLKTIQILFSVFKVYTLNNGLLNIFFTLAATGSILVGGVAAIWEDKIKKILAYSSINQIGFVFYLLFY